MQATKSPSNIEQPYLQSEEVQDIIGHVPNWIIRWGITVIFGVFVIMVFVSWLVKYPDIINAKVLLTTSPAVTTISSRSSGTLVLLKKDNVRVETGDHIAYLLTNAMLEDVLKLENYIKALGEPGNVSNPGRLVLGELQQPYNDALSALENLDNYRKFQKTTVRVNQLKHQLAVHIRLRQILVEQVSLLKEEASLAHSRYAMDSALFAQKLSPPSEHIAAKMSYLQNVRGNRGIEMTIADEDVQLASLKSQIIELELNDQEQLATLTLAYTNALRLLTMRIEQWKTEKILTSPVIGTVAFLGFLENNMFIEPNKPLFSIIPEAGSIYAQAELPIAGSGKIKEGQRVNIRLENYPSEQFGILYGKVKEVSVLPSGDKYLAKIELPDGLKTSYNTKLPFKQHLKGETEIITEDLRLLERVFYQFRNLIQVN